jgi:hypothetical protein
MMDIAGSPKGLQKLQWDGGLVDEGVGRSLDRLREAEGQRVASIGHGEVPELQGNSWRR